MLPDCPDYLLDPLDNWRRWLVLLPSPKPETQEVCLSLEGRYADHLSRFQYEGSEPRLECDWRKAERVDAAIKALADVERLLISRRHSVEAWSTVTEQQLKGYVYRCKQIHIKQVAQPLDLAYTQLKQKLKP